MFPNIDNLLHFYSIGLAFVFGAFLEEWISGRFLIKEPRGTKLIGNNNYLPKKTAITIRIIEVLIIPLLAIPLSFGLIYLFDLSSFYVVVISIAIFNTIYLGTLLELPYKIKTPEWVIIILVYLICLIATLITTYTLSNIN